ncbi:malonyl CoA-acyl carrier protein transacylase [Clostridiales bacterium]|nr:malonyl CoA-acyl carrier protein transacylase [Clostridiales bacterium]
MKTSNWCAAFPGRDALTKELDQNFYNTYTSVKKRFAQASQYFRTDIAKICYSGEIPTKWQTVCLVTHCLSIYQVAAEQYGPPCCAIGYSQGEFTACLACGAASFIPMLHLIFQLEYILQSQSAADECMYRIIGLDTAILKECCKQIDPTGEKICISSYISKDQNIISGKKDKTEHAAAIAKQKGARWALNLHSPRAYHSPLCDAAASQAKKYFSSTPFKEATLPVYSCIDGSNSKSGTDIRRKLAVQINHPIQWRKISQNLTKGGVFHLIECGPGCTVSANTRIADERIQCKWIGSINDL